MTTKPRNLNKQDARRTDQREARRQRQEGKQRRRRILYLIATGFIALLIIASLVITSLPQPSGQSGGSKRAEYANGVGTQQVLMPGSNHVDGRTVTYTTIPPTSGDHWSGSTQCGFYQEEVRDEIVMHNTEHGNVIMSYNLTDPADVTKLKDISNNIKDSGDWLVTRYYPKLQPGEVALTVWGIMDKFAGIDEARITKFVDTYKGNLLSDETRGLGQGIPCTTAQRMAK